MIADEEPPHDPDSVADRPVFLDPNGTRRLWLRLTASVAGGSGVLLMTLGGLLFSGQPSPMPATFALSPGYPSSAGERAGDVVDGAVGGAIPHGVGGAGRIPPGSGEQDAAARDFSGGADEWEPDAPDPETPSRHATGVPLEHGDDSAADITGGADDAPSGSTTADGASPGDDDPGGDTSGEGPSGGDTPDGDASGEDTQGEDTQGEGTQDSGTPGSPPAGDGVPDEPIASPVEDAPADPGSRPGPDPDVLLPQFVTDRPGITEGEQHGDTGPEAAEPRAEEPLFRRSGGGDSGRQDRG